MRREMPHTTRIQIILLLGNDRKIKKNSCIFILFTTSNFRNHGVFKNNIFFLSLFLSCQVQDKDIYYDYDESCLCQNKLTAIVLLIHICFHVSRRESQKSFRHIKKPDTFLVALRWLLV